MKKSLKELSELVGGKLKGDTNIEISGVAGLDEASGGQITFLANPKYTSKIKDTSASAIVVPVGIDTSDKPIIIVKNPYLAFAKIMELFVPEKTKPTCGIDKTAIVGEGADIAKSASIGAYSVIGDNVKIGENAVIYPHVWVAENTTIANNTIIYPHVSIRENIKIGSSVIIHSGVVIGCDGFGFLFNDAGNIEKIPQIGTVVIGDNVEIGANVSIDRGTMGATKIGNGTKLDNLVHIAHNVEVGENCMICGQVGFAGSTKIGNNVLIAGQAGLVGHITIGDKVRIGAQAGVTKSVGTGESVSGYPARAHRESLKINAQIQNLPELVERVKKLEKKLGK
ncbi:MAG: UDP-3-O-(3-hydroxymyristoyl)glucosamine N-acyltransferase [bacterium]